MRVSYEWLTEVVDLEGILPEVVADRLTNAGVAVDTVAPRAESVQGVVVGHVMDVAQHPNANRLKVCQVDIGKESNLTIVCGAPNVAVGQKVPTAVVGAMLPGGPIGRAKLRGIDSEGMLCSAAEIGLEVKWLPKEQTNGLYLLPKDAKPGDDVVKLLHLDDVILELDLTPNRADCMSIRGLAYELAAILQRPLKFNEIVPQLHSKDTPPVEVRIATPKCSRYEAQIMEFRNHEQSPLWMQMRLLAMGIRPISMIVDVTNYVMLEWGQPLHAFDMDEVHQQTIVVRQGFDGEQVRTLDGEVRTLTGETMVIADVDRAIGIAGVMGGENSEITSETRRIIIESASFDAASVRRTGQRLGLHSEAQQRFEKGIDVKAVRSALLRASELLGTHDGARAIGGIVVGVQETGQDLDSRELDDVYKTDSIHEMGNAREVDDTNEYNGLVVAFDPRHCNRVLGTQISEREMTEIFQRLGFSVADRDMEGTWQVEVPTRRPDIAIEADLVEEVGRLYGFDTIPSTLMQQASIGVRTPWQQFRQHTRNLLVSCGMNEVFPYTFSQPSAMEALRLPAEAPELQMIPLLRPMSEERSVLRTHLLPGLAGVAQYNLSHGVAGGTIFEIGRTFIPVSLPLRRQPQEPVWLAMMWFGEEEASLGNRGRAYSFYDAKGVVEVWLESLGLAEQLTFDIGDAPWLHPGRSANVMIAGQKIGSFGELHPQTATALDVGRAIYGQFDLEQVQHLQSRDWKVSKLPRFPSSSRDLAVVVQDDLLVQNLLDAAQKVAAEAIPETLESAQVFDVYTGQHVTAGFKSVAVTLRFRASNRTLTDTEVDETVSAILEAWNEQFGAELRK